MEKIIHNCLLPCKRKLDVVSVPWVCKGFRYAESSLSHGLFPKFWSLQSIVSTIYMPIGSGKSQNLWMLKYILELKGDAVIYANLWETIPKLARLTNNKDGTTLPEIPTRSNVLSSADIANTQQLKVSFLVCFCILWSYLSFKIGIAAWARIY